MHSFEYILILLAAVLVSNLISQRFPRISTPLVQIALGVVLVATPFPFEGGLDPELFLILFIAPLLFEEAKRSNRQALWNLRRPILSLAVGLVFATCMSVGFAFHWLVPSVPLAAAFAFAAALAPTDVVAVLSLEETATISRDQSELLKGEGLLNDAASIVSFQFAIAAVLTASFSPVNASVSFIFMFLGGMLVGVGLMLLRYVLMRMITNSGVESSTFFVLFEIITPCLVFLVAEVIHVSGIIAVVAAGITYASYSPKGTTPVSARNTIVSSSVWAVVTFTLNGLCFLMLGAQIPQIVGDLMARADVDFIFLGLIILLVLIVILAVRYIWALILHRHDNLTDEEDLAEAAASVAFTSLASLPVVDTDASAASTPGAAGASAPGGAPFAPPPIPPESFTERRRPSLAEQRQLREERRQARQADRQEAHADPKYWRHHIIDALQLTIAGPKGAITLALVFGIPLLMPDGGAFPERDIIMFVASGVILLSLTMTSIVMPFISPKKADEHKQEDEINAMIMIFRRVINELLDNAHPDDMPITNEVIRQYDERIRRLQTTKTLEDSEELQLRAQIASWERQNTLELIAEGRVGIWLGMFYLNSLSRQLARLEHHSTLRESLRALGDQLVLLYRRWRLILKLRQQNPDYGKLESRLQLRGLQIENLNFVLRRLEVLQQELDEMQGETPLSTHLVGHFVFDTNQQLSQSRRRFRSRMRMLTASADVHAELERQELRLTMRALQWERDAINDALRADQISRSTAKEMYDSVAAMELDIEGFIE